MNQHHSQICAWCKKFLVFFLSCSQRQQRRLLLPILSLRKQLPCAVTAKSVDGIEEYALSRGKEISYSQGADLNVRPPPSERSLNRFSDLPTEERSLSPVEPAHKGLFSSNQIDWHRRRGSFALSFRRQPPQRRHLLRR